MGSGRFLTKVERAGSGRRPGAALGAGLLGLGLLLGAGCGGDEAPQAEGQPLLAPSLDGGAAGPASDAPERAQRTPPSLPATGPRVVFLGDSLAAGLHLPADEAFPAVLADLLAAEGLPIELVNAGVSGDTTAGGLARLDWLLRQEPDLLVVELGANDGLRGVSLASVEANLRGIVEATRARGVEVLLLGMKLPPNYGADYTTGFEQLFARIAAETGVPFVPFFLDGVAADPELNLPDGIHPNSEGHRVVAENLLGALRPLVQELSADEPEGGP
jgi:acyl-CoA thioesterase-1